ncbi:MAG: hypothetical protein PHN39_01055 [Candidatus Pacebacteria bacterium]|nr:hypothetical protein [Candidatus Paceibacterota bacterium]
MSQILELYFNRNQASSAFETACFKPSNKREFAVGELFLFGEIRNMPEKGPRILNRFLQFIQQNYYSLQPNQPEPPKADILKRTLERANEFLVEIPQKEGFNLGGNLSFVALSLGPDLVLKVSRLTGVKVYLLRDGQVTNVADSLPGAANNLFSNVLEGQTKEGDKILVFNKELSAIFETEKILHILSNLSAMGGIKKIIKKHKKALKEAMGACLIILVKKEKPFYWPSLSVPEHNPLFQFFQKTLPSSPRLKSIILKILISIAALAILLPLGYFIFR